jgi:hypothetical protein
MTSRQPPDPVRSMMSKVSPGLAVERAMAEAKYVDAFPSLDEGRLLPNDGRDCNCGALHCRGGCGDRLLTSETIRAKTAGTTSASVWNAAICGTIVKTMDANARIAATNAGE